MKPISLQILLTPKSRQIFAALKNQALFVGGCVRDCLMGIMPHDIDIATPLHPDEVIKHLTASGITAIPTGYKHGTITAVIDGTPFEITSLRCDKTTDGRHAVTAFGTDYVTDAARRDFTINALYADGKGQIHDFLGTGLYDIKHQNLRFIGVPETRIHEDYLRILRYFRFMGKLNLSSPDKSAIRAIKNTAPFIAKLSKERILNEFSQILMADNVIPILKIMRKVKVLKQISPYLTNLNHLEKVLTFAKHYHLPFPFEARLYALCMPSKVATLSASLSLSRKSVKTLKALSQNRKVFNCLLKQGIKPSLFLYGKELSTLSFCLNGGLNKDFAFSLKNSEKIKEILTFFVPQCPISNKDIITFGYKGKDIGLEMTKLKNKWLATNCTLPRNKLLALIKKV